LKNGPSVVGLVSCASDERVGEPFFDERQRDVRVFAEQPADEVSALVHGFDLDVDLPLHDQFLDEAHGLIAEGLRLGDRSAGHCAASARTLDSGEEEGDDAGLPRNVKTEPGTGRNEFNDGLDKIFN